MKYFIAQAGTKGPTCEISVEDNATPWDVLYAMLLQDCYLDTVWRARVMTRGERLEFSYIRRFKQIWITDPHARGGDPYWALARLTETAPPRIVTVTALEDPAPGCQNISEALAEMRPVTQSSIACPNCGSHSVQRVGYFERGFAAGIFGHFSPEARGQFKCNSCGYRW